MNNDPRKNLGGGLTPQKRRRRRAATTAQKTAAGLGAVLLVFGTVFFVQGRSGKSARNRSTAQNAAHASTAAVESIEATLSPEESRAAELEANARTVVDGYHNLGIVNVEGYLNMHKEGSQNSEINGKLYGGSACEILDKTADGWYHISSGGFEGYVHSDYVKTGEEAKTLALQNVKRRAIVKADKLNIRSAPSKDADSVGTALQYERYEVLGEENGFVKTRSGYISADYVEIRDCLNEARKQDLRAMVLNMYDNLGVSEVTGYLNIREEPKEDGKIIGKLTSKAGCDVLENANGWLKIKSGGITGYVKAEYIATGEQAKEEAMKSASLMAIVHTDVLNARSEPKEDSAIWTQINNSERYPVVEQLDGWVKLELEEGDDVFVKSEYVDVRYALNEAIHFSPQEEAEHVSLSRRQQIVNFALQYLGNPYVWGGTSLEHGCDCSGFTMKVMEHYGVSLPHYSGSQAQMGKKVSKDEMRPGDLVFYSNSRGTINHVGIYIGNGQIVNAASRRSGIKISTWNYRTPRAIRNVLGD